MLALLYRREEHRAGLDLDLVVAGVFSNELIQIFWFDPNGITNLNRRELSLLDEFVDKSFAAIKDHCDLRGFQQFCIGLMDDLVHKMLLNTCKND